MTVPKVTLLLLASWALASCAKPEQAEKLPDIRLPTYAAQEGPSLATCPAKKCLTVYLAPWCVYCRMNTPLLISLRKFLKKRGVETRFIVGKDRMSALRQYAQVFGPDTLLDISDDFQIGGVPHFFITDSRGTILQEVSGLPMGESSVKELAAFFGLP